MNPRTPDINPYNLPKAVLKRSVTAGGRWFNGHSREDGGTVLDTDIAELLTFRSRRVLRSLGNLPVRHLLLEPMQGNSKHFIIGVPLTDEDEPIDGDFRLNITYRGWTQSTMSPLAPPTPVYEPPFWEKRMTDEGEKQLQLLRYNPADSPTNQ